MEHTKHTPGPLYAEDRGNGEWNVREENTGAVLARCFDSDWHPNQRSRVDLPAEANATLYAAAPDLLEVVEFAEFHIRQNGTLQGNRQTFMDKARAALARARGEER